MLDNAAAHAKLVEEMAQDVAAKNKSLVLINQIYCGTHVLQLSTNDALRAANSSYTIEKVHDMCVALRNQVVMIAVRKMDCKVIIPPLHNSTRWNSKFTMVFIHLFTICTYIANCNRTSSSAQGDNANTSTTDPVLPTCDTGEWR